MHTDKNNTTNCNSSSSNKNGISRHRGAWSKYNLRKQKQKQQNNTSTTSTSTTPQNKKCKKNRITNQFKKNRNKHNPVLKPLNQTQITDIHNTITNTNELPLCKHLGPEFDNGCVEYKWKLLNPCPDRLQHLITQMNYRLGEGDNICYYQVGVLDNGTPQGLNNQELIASVSTIFLMANQIANVTATINQIQQGNNGKICKLKINRDLNSSARNSRISSDIRLCVAGNAGVGKSTLIGVLTRGKLDDGHGSARKHVIQHRHEIRDGRTSSISYHILGFDDHGSVTNYKAIRQGEWNEIIGASTKLITFVDQPGDNRYLKTSILGLSSNEPHYVMLTVSLDEFDKKSASGGQCQPSLGKLSRPPKLDEDVQKNKNELWSRMLSLNLDNLLGTDDTSDFETSDDSVSEYMSDHLNIRKQPFKNLIDKKSMQIIRASASTKNKPEGVAVAPIRNQTEGQLNSENIRNRKENNLIRNDIKLPSICSLTSSQSSAQSMQKSKSKSKSSSKSIDPSAEYHKYIRIFNLSKFPLFIVITKSDLDQLHHYQRVPKMLHKIEGIISKKFENRLKIKVIKRSSDVLTAAHSFTHVQNVVTHIPIFIVSSTNGEGLDLLKTFLFSLQAPATTEARTYIPKLKTTSDNTNSQTEFGIYHVYNVASVGIVFFGIVRRGIIRLDDEMLFGPDLEGKYYKVSVKSIHVRKQPCVAACSQEMAGILVKECQIAKQVRRGMVLVSLHSAPEEHTGFAFEAKFEVLPACYIEEHSQPIVHIDSTRQSAHLIQLKPRTKLFENETGSAIFSFLHRPEYIRLGRRIIIRRSHGPIAIGLVLRILDRSDQRMFPMNLTKKHSRKKSIHQYLSKWNLNLDFESRRAKNKNKNKNETENVSGNAENERNEDERFVEETEIEISSVNDSDECNLGGSVTLHAVDQLLRVFDQ